MKFKFHHLPEYSVSLNGITVTVLHMPSGILVINGLTPNAQHNAEAAYDDCRKAVAKYEAAVLAAMPIAQTQVRLYGCHDAPRPVAGAVTHYGQDGFNAIGVADDGVKLVAIRVVPIQHVMSTDCQYDKQQSDRSCTNCKHIRK